MRYSSPWRWLLQGHMPLRLYSTMIPFHLEPSSSTPRPICEPYRHQTINPTLQQQRPFPFLSLPPELRIQIYDLLLSRTTPNTIPSTPLSPKSPTHTHTQIHPAILLTNKQIHTESLPILYTHNHFTASTPDHLSHFITQIGPHNIQLLRSLSLFIPWRGSEVWPWVILLTYLSQKATGLRWLEVGWGANCEDPWNLKPGAEERGLGDNVLFVQALARIKQAGTEGLVP
ncbi:uncharacterized protein BO80DRAFT_135796 [Aspergillus ibericus CBS 121593]|uniref:2EXR domain-containing protein n=1 Tax=Aspergillus ibericus CBS 121593 TaxID=1448316 RepID=A0A395HGL3_9EURO|nr:hypothetical protein BO80DRAFT_135796 [Aspergillus ibericus CBS 121593]RAL05364.1 hypothetical protein BO80DRAFT_135796 [Aspergillus ibericus CBS 121593]